MRQVPEIAGFLLLALGLHVVLLGLARDRESGIEAAGEGGAAQVSLQAADAQIAAMVARWERPPQAATGPEVPTMAAPAALETVQLPDNPAPVMPPPAAPTGLAMPDMSERGPPLDPEVTRSPAPSADTEVAETTSPQTSQRPNLRPRALSPPPERKVAEKPKLKKTQAPSAVQRASGAGGGGNAGSAQRRETSTQSASQGQSLTARWGAQIRDSVERRKRYPGAARGASGSVTVRLTVSRGGRLQDVSLVRSSGNAALDQAATRAVRAARFPAAPGGLTQPTYSFTLPMKFSS